MEWSCSFVFQLLYHHQNATIMGLVCCVLAGDGHGNLQTYCVPVCDNQTLCRSLYLYTWDPAEHLRFINPCNFRILDRLSATDWLQLLIFGMGFQLISLIFTERGFWVAHYMERCAALYTHLTCTATLYVYEVCYNNYKKR